MAVIHTLTLPTPFAVGDVNAFLIEDEKIILIDTGCKSTQSWKVLGESLEKAGIRFDQIDELWLTHAHPDHCGFAAKLQKEYGVKVGMHAHESATKLKGTRASNYDRFFRASGVDEVLIKEMLRQQRWYETFYDDFESDFFIKDGDRFSTGNSEFVVKELSGHSVGHLGFFGNGVMFTGDILLERISSNALLSFNPETGERIDALARLRESLQYLETLSGTVYPGHGDFFANPANTAHYHLSAQDRRYQSISKVVGDHPGNLFELTQIVFPDMHLPHNTFLCLSEVQGYLDRGEKEGLFVKDADGNYRKS